MLLPPLDALLVGGVAGAMSAHGSQMRRWRRRMQAAMLAQHGGAAAAQHEGRGRMAHPSDSSARRWKQPRIMRKTPHMRKGRSSITPTTQ